MKDNLLNNLYWEKYRPTKLEDVILPERIKSVLDKGIITNMIFTGSPGCGKTTCAKILLQNYHSKTFTAKLGVDVLRTEIDKFCKEMIISFDENDEKKDKKIRIIYFEEFDRATNALQEELKSFIEEHSERVRFLATCNNINQINEPIQSRFNIIDFTPIDQNEVKELRNGYLKRIFEIIKLENIKISKEDLKDIIVKRFPDFRKIWQDLQYYALSGGFHNAKFALGEEKLFELIINGDNTLENWDYVQSHWADKVPVAFQMLGRPFFKWVKEKHPNLVNKLGDHLIQLSEFSDVRLPQAMDQFVTLCAFIYVSQKTFKK